MSKERTQSLVEVLRESIYCCWAEWFLCVTHMLDNQTLLNWFCVKASMVSRQDTFAKGQNREDNWSYKEIFALHWFHKTLWELHGEWCCPARCGQTFRFTVGITAWHRGLHSYLWIFLHLIPTGFGVTKWEPNEYTDWFSTVDQCLPLQPSKHWNTLMPLKRVSSETALPSDRVRGKGAWVPHERDTKANRWRDGNGSRGIVSGMCLK